MSRGRDAGTSLGKAIVEMAELMYQENTKKNFLDGLYEEIKWALHKVIKKQKAELDKRSE